MAFLSAILGVSVLLAKRKLVRGLVRCVRSHVSISRRSYVCPSAVSTGLSITSSESGQTNASGGDGAILQNSTACVDGMSTGNENVNSDYNEKKYLLGLTGGRVTCRHLTTCTKTLDSLSGLFPYYLGALLRIQCSSRDTEMKQLNVGVLT